MTEPKISKSKRVCQVKGCFRKHYGKNFCARHYLQVWKYGFILKDKPVGGIKCSIDGCNKKHLAKGLCSTHYMQIRRYGNISTRTNHTPNIFNIEGDICRIVLFNNKNKKAGVTIIDTKNLKKCKNHKWHLSASGYATTTINNKNICLHKHIAPKKLNDHRDRNKLNNKESNLRCCNRSQNQQNIGITANNNSGFKNVHWIQKRKRWGVAVIANKIRHHIGYFTDIADANQAAIMAREKYHGKFACNY